MTIKHVYILHVQLINTRNIVLLHNIFSSNHSGRMLSFSPKQNRIIKYLLNAAECQHERILLAKKHALSGRFGSFCQQL